MVSTAVPRADVAQAMKELNLSSEEVNKFEKAFKDPEFVKLFADYAKEVSDPKAKAENDAYLRQLENEGRTQEVCGKDVILVVPEERFVIKTRNKENSQKVYINVCASDKVEKIKMHQGVNESGKAGTHVEIPLVLGNMKAGLDKTGGAASVWDFVVHPETVTSARQRQAVMNTLAETAMEHIEKHNSVKLDRAYKVPKMKYKKTEGVDGPTVMTIRNADGTPMPGLTSTSGSTASSPPLPTTPAAATAAAALRVGAPAAAAAATAGDSSSKANKAGSTFSFGSKTKAATAAAPVAVDPKHPGFVHPGGEVTPQWEVVHRGVLDLADAWGDAGRNFHVTSQIPKELVIRIQLTGVSSASEVDVEVTARKIDLTVPGRYILSAALPYDVDDVRGRAKFDKQKSSLTITVPVVPPPPPSQPLPAPLALVSELLPPSQSPSVEEGSEPSATPANGHHASHGPTADHDPSTLPSSTTQDVPSLSNGEQPHAPSATELSTADPTNGLRSHDLTTEAGSSHAPASGGTGVEATEQMTENQRKWAALHETSVSQQQEQQQEDQVSEESAEGAASQNGIASHGISASSEPGAGVGNLLKAAPTPSPADAGGQRHTASQHTSATVTSGADAKPKGVTLRPRMQTDAIMAELD